MSPAPNRALSRDHTPAANTAFPAPHQRHRDPAGLEVRINSHPQRTHTSLVGAGFSRMSQAPNHTPTRDLAPASNTAIPTPHQRHRDPAGLDVRINSHPQRTHTGLVGAGFSRMSPAPDHAPTRDNTPIPNTAIPAPHQRHRDPAGLEVRKDSHPQRTHTSPVGAGFSRMSPAPNHAPLHDHAPASNTAIPTLDKNTEIQLASM